ncbi:hypothetical protein [Demequina activiva]|uniref:hypothetical protein n=1 Tax=Demequina activiva TaxID=1582364 RepID=UPI00194237D9|nr:hypothetical protein [Demequina activiva]
MESTREHVPALRWTATAIIAVEALALVVAAVIYVARAIDGAAPADAALSIAALALAAGAALAVAAAAYARGRTWPRGLAVTWQLLQIAAGVLLLELLLAAGIAAIAAGVVGAAALIADARTRPTA